MQSLRCIFEDKETNRSMSEQVGSEYTPLLAYFKNTGDNVTQTNNACMHTFTHVHPRTQTHRQTDRQTHTHTHLGINNSKYKTSQYSDAYI